MGFLYDSGEVVNNQMREKLVNQVLAAFYDPIRTLLEGSQFSHEDLFLCLMFYMKFRHWTYVEAEVNFFNISVIPNYAKWWYDLKLGLGLTNLEMRKGTMANADHDGSLLFGPYPEETNPKSSLIQTAFVGYTLMAHRRLNQGTSLGFGITLRTNTKFGNFTRTEYTDTDGKKTVQMSELGRMRTCQWSALAQYNLDQNVYLYSRYSPWSPFRKGCSPDYSSLTMGFGVKF